HCRPPGAGAYPALLDFVARARRFVPNVTVTAIGGLAGVEIGACRAIAEALGVGFRARELDRVG
ncbi:MAG: radical SAM protein, partial [Thiohalorhabdaceae bacterium]